MDGIDAGRPGLTAWLTFCAPHPGLGMTRPETDDDLRPAGPTAARISSRPMSSPHQVGTCFVPLPWCASDDRHVPEPDLRLNSFPWPETCDGSSEGWLWSLCVRAELSHGHGSNQVQRGEPSLQQVLDTIQDKVPCIPQNLFDIVVSPRPQRFSGYGSFLRLVSFDTRAQTDMRR